MCLNIYHHQFSSVAQSCPTLCSPMDCSTPGFPVHGNSRSLLRHISFSDAIQPSHPLSTPSPPAFNLSQHQGLFKWVSSSHQVVKVLEFRLQHRSFQWIFRTDFLRMDCLDLLAVQGNLKSLFLTPQFKSINSLGLSFLCNPTLTSIHDYSFG